ncbi:hypothetical protein [Halopelagius longus]|uniref:DUF3800 domain-containing protein n=1 Tax=Halopelagius longus TaxID=1236180 RepID=A0A1H0XNW3_9EURY|nr:hypothetical protein [Halopelagius longus]RDI71981.1 hypothetical protein DWB78_09745 [Halopelagius longus]SDQ04607.1 hypothetical protein SAMN05216278_0051 [Halopelagius longus]
MQDFIVDDQPRSRSIGFDATDRQNVVVTVGVLLNRTQEASLLDDLYRTISDDGYLPFRTKSRDLSLPSQKVVDILRRCNGKVGICVHTDDVKLPFAEAVHSAMILNNLGVTTDDTIAIVDGDESRAEKLYQGASAIDIVPPSIVNCVRSELYYPHLLLADLVAGIIADAVSEDSAVLSSISPEGPVEAIINTTQDSQQGFWGRGYSAVARGEGEVQRATYEQRYASSLRERVTCWFNGSFGQTHAPPPESDGVQPVVGRLNAIGCSDVAMWLDSQ